MGHRTVLKDPEYNGHTVMVDPGKKLYCDKKILKAIEDQFEYAEQSQKRVFFMRYDIRFPEGVNEHTDNKLVRDFQANLIKTLKRQGLNPNYLLVREQSQEKHQHYHGVLMLEGRETQSIHNHIAAAERRWNSALDLPSREGGYGLIDDCTKDRNGNRQENGVMLRHDDSDYESKRDECFRRASYLAKINQKANTPKGQRELFTSRIPKKSNLPK